MINLNQNSIINVQLENVNNKIYANSKDIANKLGKEHSKLCNKIKEILGIVKFGDTPTSEFIAFEKTVINPQNKQEYKEYLLDKDAFTLLLFNYTGYNDFKKAYINAFNKMEQALLNQAENKIEEEKEEDNNISLYYKNEFVKTDKIQEYIINDPLLGYNFFRYKIVNERPLLNIGDIVRMIDYEQKISPFVNDLWKGLDFVYDLLDNKSTKNKTLSYYLHKFRVEYMFIKNNDLFIEEKKNPLELYLEIQEQKRLGERLRSATELANELEISAQMVGRIANKIDIKDKEHGD